MDIDEYRKGLWKESNKDRIILEVIEDNYGYKLVAVDKRASSVWLAKNRYVLMAHIADVLSAWNADVSYHKGVGNL